MSLDVRSLFRFHPKTCLHADQEQFRLPAPGRPATRTWPRATEARPYVLECPPSRSWKLAHAELRGRFRVPGPAKLQLRRFWHRARGHGLAWFRLAALVQTGRVRPGSQARRLGFFYKIDAEWILGRAVMISRRQKELSLINLYSAQPFIFIRDS